MECMIDNHIHIGQYKDIYYEPKAILSVVLESGVDELFFSSTTTCKNNIKYVKVEKEISNALSQIGTMAIKTHPLLWYSPFFIKQGVLIDKAMNNLPYHGIKIHPFAHNWDISNTSIANLLHEIFDYANVNQLIVLIHTGEDSICAANKFASFFTEYSKAKFILAHGRPIKQTIDLLQKLPNVYCDTAFMPTKDIKAIVNNKLGKKVLLGSDFPITHYYSLKTDKILNRYSIEKLKNQYAIDIENMQYNESLLVK